MLALVMAVPTRAVAMAPESAETPPAEKAEPTTEEPADPEALRDPMVEARRAYDLGRQQYDEAKYEDALGSFLDAQRLYASPDHHFNIARCYEALGRYELAIEYYRAYLRSDPSDRANIENTIARLEKIVAQPEPEPEPKPEPEPEPEPVVTTPEDGDRVGYPGRGMVIGGSVLLGAGVAVAVGGGAGAGLVARDRSDQVDQVFNAGNPAGLSQAATRSLDEEGRRFEAIQIATIAVGGAMAAGGAVLIALGVRKKNHGTAWIAPGPRGLAFGGRF